MPKIDKTHNKGATGLYLAELVANISMGMMNGSARGDLVRNVKLLGDNGFGSDRYPQLVILDKAWPMIEREAVKLNEQRTRESKAPIDIKGLKARFDKIYQDYQKKTQHIAQLQGVSAEDATQLIDRTVAKGALLLPSNTSSSLIQLLQEQEQEQEQEQGSLLTAFRGGSLKELPSVTLKQLTEKFEKAAHALAQHDTRHYDESKYPNKFDTLYQNYVKSSANLKRFITNSIVGEHCGIKAAEKDPDFSSKVGFEATMALEKIRNMHDKSFRFYYRRVNPAPGLTAAITEYEKALDNFYSTVLQGRSNARRELDDVTERAHQKVLTIIEDAIEQCAHSPSQVETLEALKEKHIQDKLYLLGKLNAQHIRHGASAFPEEVFDHPELWQHLETGKSKEVDRFFDDLHEQLPGTAVLTEQLDQAFFGTPVKAILHHHQLGKRPSISKKELNITFNDEGNPIINCDAEIDYFIDFQNSTINYANEEGVLQTLSFEGTDIDEIPSLMEGVRRTPIARLSYQLTLDSPNMQHMRVKSLDNFNLSLADGIAVPQDLPPEVALSSSITETEKQGLSLRELCQSAGIPLPQSSLSIDMKPQVPQDDREAETCVAIHQELKSTLKEIRDQHNPQMQPTPDPGKDEEHEVDEHAVKPFSK